MPTVLSLPAELLIDIASLVTEPEPLLKVCRTFRGIAIPVVYRDISLRYRKGEDNTDIELLLRTIVSRPALGAFVRRLRLSRRGGGFDELGLSYSDEGIRALVLEAAASQDLSEDIIYGLELGFYGAALFLLLCYFPKLESLEFCRLPAGDFFSYISSSDNLPSGLQSLRSIHIIRPGPDGYIQQENIFTVFRLPSLRTLMCSYMDIEGGSHGDCVLFDGTSQLEEIMMDRCIVSGKFLATMVRSTGALRALAYSYGGGVMGHLALHTTILGDTLRTHALHTLESLNLDFPYSDEPLGPLCGFTKLQRVSLNMSLLLGAPSQVDPLPFNELLPSSLTSLTLRFSMAWWDAGSLMVARLVETKRDNIPCLKELRIRGTLVESEVRMLSSACSKEGVEFRHDLK